MCDGILKLSLRTEAFLASRVLHHTILYIQDLEVRHQVAETLQKRNLLKLKLGRYVTYDACNTAADINPLIFSVRTASVIEKSTAGRVPQPRKQKLKHSNKAHSQNTPLPEKRRCIKKFPDGVVKKYMLTTINAH
jgi:hypothetical protein